jgi:4-hydroxybenzoate polyprenyltransferase
LNNGVIVSVRNLPHSNADPVDFFDVNDLTRAVDLIYRRLRLRNPWTYKAPLLIAFPYFVIAAARVPWDRALLGVLASCCTIAGIAGVAYFLNDLTDVGQDRLAGKDNAVAGLNWPQRALLLALFLAAALAPWIYLPFTRTTGVLLAAELALFVVYCVPPFRVKERGVLGIMTDAAYAHALPAVLAVLTFAEMASEPYGQLALFASVLGAWQLALGMRNIVLHQLQDYERDAHSGTQTLAITIGPKRLASLLKVVFVPLEIVAFSAFAIVVSWEVPWFPLASVACIALATARLRLLQLPFPATIREGLYIYADNFYADWLPLVILGYMIARVPATWPIAVLHLLLFRSGVRQSIRDLKARFVTPLAAGRAS